MCYDYYYLRKFATLFIFIAEEGSKGSLSIIDLSFEGAERILVVKVFINHGTILRAHIVSKSSTLCITETLTYMTLDLVNLVY